MIDRVRTLSHASPNRKPGLLAEIWLALHESTLLIRHPTKSISLEGTYNIHAAAQGFLGCLVDDVYDKTNPEHRVFSASQVVVCFFSTFAKPSLVLIYE